MLATAQSGQELQVLNESSKLAVKRVFEGLTIDSQLLELPAGEVADAQPLPENMLGVVEHGLVSVLSDNTVVSMLDPGDLVIPDNDCLPANFEPLLYSSETGAGIRVYNRQQFLDGLALDAQCQRFWQNALTLHATMLMRLNALHIREAVGNGGSPEVYPAGTVIIQQGDPADDVFSMSEGHAEVLVNDMPVARIGPGELFGTMAALTDSHRNATVRALESCSVIRVPKERFFELIRSRPAAVQGLLVDMARSISELNEEVVALRQRLGGR